VKFMRALFMAATLAVAATAANATPDSVIFGFTNSSGPTQQLILNGSTTLLTGYPNDASTGWYDQTGYHDSANPNYAVGNCYSLACSLPLGPFGTNDYFVFDLSGVTGPITSASLSIYNPGAPPSDGFFGVPGTLSIYDVTTPISALEASNAGAVSVYNDLGSGVLYGSVGVSAADNGQFVNITLNSAALTLLNANVGNQVAFGGSLGPFISAVPEPLSLSLFGAGLAGVGALRRRKAKS
jgi:hypothetical protein